MAMPAPVLLEEVRRQKAARRGSEEVHVEILAFADEVAAAVERFGMAISQRSWNAANGERERLGGRAVAFRAEYLRLTGGSPDAA